MFDAFVSEYFIVALEFSNAQVMEKKYLNLLKIEINVLLLYFYLMPYINILIKASLFFKLDHFNFPMNIQYFENLMLCN